MKYTDARFISLLLASGAALAYGCSSSTSQNPQGAGLNIGAGGNNGGATGAGNNSTESCKSDKECGASSEICDRVRNVCVSCLDDDDCSEGDICRDSICEAATSCKGSKECAPTGVCSKELSYCVECEGDNDCGAGQICSSNSCRTQCTSDKECGAEDMVCDQKAGICQDCVTSDDCADAQYCSSGGTCRTQLCSTATDLCAEGTFRTCNKDGSGFSLSECSGKCLSDQSACDSKGGNPSGGSCSTGDQDCSCYGNDTCNDSLSCINKACVDPDGTTATGGSGNDGTGGGSAGTAPSEITCSSPGAIADFENAPSADFCGSSPIGAWTNFSSPTYVSASLEMARAESANALHIGPMNQGGDSGVIGKFTAPYDAASYSGFGFWAKAASGGQTLGVGVHTPDTGALGFVLNTDNLSQGLTLTDEWVFYEIKFSEMLPRGSVVTSLDAPKIREIQFIVAGETDLWIDDIRFIGN